MIRLAKKEEIGQILSLTRACAAHMIAQQIFQWNEHYPSAQAFENDIDRQELYLYESQNTIVGCFVVSTFMDTEYLPIAWSTPNDHNYYIHRLGVHPEHQKKGIARAMMDFAEDLARSNGAHAVRLDTFSQNKRNQRFYINRGYNQLSNIYFPKQSEYPFYCYELLLNPS
ncbi:MAG: GNAT family N-acetyltransferase [Gilvibacter sp.]